MPVEPMDLNQEINNDKPLTSYEIMIKMAKAIEELAAAVAAVNERLNSIEKQIVTRGQSWGTLNDPWQVQVNPYIYPINGGTTTSTMTYTVPPTLENTSYLTSTYTGIFRDVENSEIRLNANYDMDYDDEFEQENVDYIDDEYLGNPF